VAFLLVGVSMEELLEVRTLGCSKVAFIAFVKIVVELIIVLTYPYLEFNLDIQHQPWIKALFNLDSLFVRTAIEMAAFI
jgi:hypothetical protein